jgi:KaiC/GvpD/RAD55 family RecA-like ATPase
MREERITTGNDALDEMLGGGFLPKQMIVIAGPAGSGKTISALQFIYANLQAGKKCLFVSASDTEESIIVNSMRFGWDLKQYIDKNQLTIASIRLADALPDFSADLLSEQGMYSSSLEQLPKILKASKAEIIAIDSITEFNDICTSELERRARILNLRRIIGEIGATALLVAEVSPEGKSTKYGIAEYVADGLILLSRFQSEDFSQYLHTIQIIKMRWIAHSREIRVYDITNRGLVIRSPLYTTLASGGKLR